MTNITIAVTIMSTTGIITLLSLLSDCWYYYRYYYHDYLIVEGMDSPENLFVVSIKRGSLS